MIRARSKAKSHFMDVRARLWTRAESTRRSERGKADANGRLSWFEAIEAIGGQSQEEWRATSHGSSDVRISCFPINHHALRTIQIDILHHCINNRLRPPHESDLLQRRFLVNIGLQSNVVKAPFNLTRFCRLVKRRDRQH